MAARPVPPAFDARRSAEARTYLYRVLGRLGRPGLEDGAVAWVPKPLDADAMAVAARHLEGQYDCSAFRAAGCQAADPVRRIQRVAVWSQGPEVRVAVRATAFLYNMVRIMVGSLLEVGQGRQDPDWVATVRDSRDREQAGPTARPEGLYFAAAHYPSELGGPEPPRTGPGGFDPAAF
ncbi:MAG: tRNA pseudouridine(38-40) synthase TruA [Thiohalorhabdaceae bacterium]